MESDVSPFNAWPGILFTTLQRAGAKPAGEINDSANLTLRVHAGLRRRRSPIQSELPPRAGSDHPGAFFGVEHHPEEATWSPLGDRCQCQRFLARDGIAATASRDAAALRAASQPRADPGPLYPPPSSRPGSPELLPVCPHRVPCHIPTSPHSS